MVETTLDISSSFGVMLQNIGITNRSANALIGLGIQKIEELFVMEEAELTSLCYFSFSDLVRFRLIKKSQKPLPNSLLSLLPRYRGTSEKATDDPTAFLRNFSTVMNAGSVPTAAWASSITLLLTKPEDAAFWKAHLDRNPTYSWEEHRGIFLRHFEVFDQKMKFMDQLVKLKQFPGEKIRSFLDRSAELAEKIPIDLNDYSLIYYIRKGFLSSQLRQFVDGREPHGAKWTFDSFSEAALMGEDRLMASSSVETPPRLTCRYCSRPGHRESECRKKLEDRMQLKTPKLKPKPALTHPCANCPSADHNYSKCPKNKCSICDQKGHLNFNCPRATCSVCNTRGHTAQSFDCPKNPKKQNKPSSHYFVSLSEIEEYLQEKEKNSKFFEKYLSNLESFIVAATRISELDDKILVPIILKIFPSDQTTDVFGALDTLASNSLISVDLAHRLGIYDQCISVHTRAKTAFQSLDTIELKLSPTLEIQCGSQKKLHQFYVADISVELIIGMDLFAPLGFSLGSVPCSFPLEQNTATTVLSSSSSENHQDGVFSNLRQIDKDELLELRSHLDPLLKENEKIGLDEFCNHPAAELSINLNDKSPIFRPQFEIPSKLYSVVDEQISKWLENGKIEKGDPLSRCNSSLLLAPKRDLLGNKLEWRICFDGRPLNERLEPDTYGIPRVRELFRRVYGFRYCSSLDLVSAFNQLPLRPEHRTYTTFTWNGQKYQFAAAPFGLTHIPGHFQRLMSAILTKHSAYVLSYIDDIFIFSATLDEHKLHCAKVIKTLTKCNLRLRPEKCHFGFQEASLLGHIIDGNSIRADAAKISTFTALAKPFTGKQLQAFLGFSGYLRDYIPGYSTIAKPLEEIKFLKCIRDVWNQKHDYAFETLKKILASAPILSNPDFELPMMVATDASQNGIGAVLYQEVDQQIKYIAFFSKSLTKSQRNYPATKRELLAIISSLKNFRFFLYGRRFTLFTDHKALTYMFVKKELPYVIAHWYEEIMEFDFEIRHRPGIEMVLPDALSRLYSDYKASLRGNELPTTVAVNSISLQKKCCARRISRHCPERLCLVHCTGCPVHPRPQEQTSNEKPTTIEIDTDEPSQLDLNYILKNFSGKEIPENKYEEIEKIHKTNHAGPHSIFMTLFRNGFFWDGMKKDITAQLSGCVECLQYNLVRKGFHPLRTINATYPFDHVSIDLGQFSETSKNGKNYFLVVVDICTKFIILRSLENKAAITIAKELYSIFCDFGTPKILQSDNGSEFKNQVISALRKHCNFEHRFSTAYYPQSNGAAEAMVKKTKQILKKRLKGDYTEWDLHLPGAQLAINSTATRRHGSTPFSLMYARPSNMNNGQSEPKSVLLTQAQILARNAELIELLYPSIRLSSDSYNQRMIQDFSLNHKILQEGYPNGALVMKLIDGKADKKNPQYEGPFKVLKRTADRAYVLLDNTGTLYPKNVPPSKLKLVNVPDLYLADNNFEVEQIMNHRGNTHNREYLVKWKNYDRSHNSWEPAANFDTPEIIEEYWKKKKTRKRSR